MPFLAFKGKDFYEVNLLIGRILHKNIMMPRLRTECYIPRAHDKFN